MTCYDKDERNEGKDRGSGKKFLAGGQEGSICRPVGEEEAADRDFFSRDQLKQYGKQQGMLRQVQPDMLQGLHQQVFHAAFG